MADSESELEAESGFPVVDDTVEGAEARLGDLLGVGEGVTANDDAVEIATETIEAGTGEEITGSSESTADEEDIKLHNQNRL